MNSKSPYIFILFIFFLVFNYSAFGQSYAYQALLETIYESDFPTKMPGEIKDLSQYQVLDAREKHEFQVSHLDQANWVGYETFSLAQVAELDKQKPVLIYCTVGARSQDIGQQLIDAGFAQVYNLYGGIIQWANEELPLYKEKSPTNEVHTYSQLWGIWLKNGKKVY